MNYTFNVPDMSCNHCKMRIESTLSGSGQVETVEVDLETKKVKVESSLGPKALVELFDEAGYDAELTGTA